MKVILNDIIRDIEGKELTTENFENGEMITTPLKFCSIIYNKLLSTKPRGDIQTKEYYSLAEKMYELSLTEPQEIEITDGEYMICRNILSKERLIIQAKFLEMVNELNPVPEEVIEESVEMHIEPHVEDTLQNVVVE